LKSSSDKTEASLLTLQNICTQDCEYHIDTIYRSPKKTVYGINLEQMKGTGFTPNSIPTIGDGYAN